MWGHGSQRFLILINVLFQEKKMWKSFGICLLNGKAKTFQFRWKWTGLDWQNPKDPHDFYSFSFLKIRPFIETSNFCRLLFWFSWYVLNIRCSHLTEIPGGILEKLLLLGKTLQILNRVIKSLKINPRQTFLRQKQIRAWTDIDILTYHQKRVILCLSKLLVFPFFSNFDIFLNFFVW